MPASLMKQTNIPEHSDPWYLRLSGPMRQAFEETVKHGRLYFFAGHYAAHPLGIKFQEGTILSLIERGLLKMYKPGRHVSSHYVMASALGRLWERAKEKAMKKAQTQ